MNRRRSGDGLTWRAQGKPGGKSHQDRHRATLRAHFAALRDFQVHPPKRRRRPDMAGRCAHFASWLDCMLVDQDPDEKKGPDEKHMRAVEEGRCLFVVGIPPLWSVSQTEEFFSYHGVVESVYLLGAEQSNVLALCVHVPAVPFLSQGCTCRKPPTGGRPMSTSLRRKGRKLPPWCATGSLRVIDSSQNRSTASRLEVEHREETHYLCCSIKQKAGRRGGLRKCDAHFWPCRRQDLRLTREGSAKDCVERPTWQKAASPARLSPEWSGRL